ncbi:ATP-binding protein [Candidatus Fermentibacteria bacterium]|nr:ATP-binding protein [Candidatus Fermentibacteria bacterium]
MDDPRFGKMLNCPRCGHVGRHERRIAFFEKHRARFLSCTVTRPEQTFATFNTRDVSPAIRKAYRAAQAFAKEPRGWLVLHGPPGTGKSHLASAIDHACGPDAHPERPSLCLVMPDLLRLLRSGFDSGDHDELLDFCLNVELLIIDDMGTESATPWAQQTIFQITNYRYNRALPSVFIFNGEVDDFDPRIASRLKDRALSTIVSVYGDDYRARRRA